MRTPIRVAAAIAATAALGLPATTALGSPSATAARKHCKRGYTLKHNKCVKKHTSVPLKPTY
jgi:hypothetical protein